MIQESMTGEQSFSEGFRESSWACPKERQIIITKLAYKGVCMVRAETVEQIATAWIGILPLLQKKMPRGDGSTGNKLAFNSQSYVLMLLQNQKAMPVSEIGKQLMISPSNTTPLIDKLINERLVVRRPDKSDRRVINVAITRRGLERLDELYRANADIFKSKLSNLSDDDLNLLLLSLQNILKIAAKVSADPESSR
jgi:DNA-binding MarR family transcriptional regulator